MRNKLIEAIVNEAKKHPANSEAVIRESLKWVVSDMSLVALAQEIGIDTDKVLAEDFAAKAVRS